MHYSVHVVFSHRLGNAQEGFEPNDECPVLIRQIVFEIFFQQIDGLARQLRSQHKHVYKRTLATNEDGLT
jgi:hypothetical protein